MRRIDQMTVQRILDTADIVEVVSDFVELKRRGANYMGLCPFHNERTPSFSVNRARGICKCFSCGEGGSAVNFVMKIRQCSYGEALRYLAQKYNIEIKEAELSDEELRLKQERDALYAAAEAAAEYMRSMRSTPEGMAALEPLAGRRCIPAAMLDACGIGYLPSAPGALAQALAQKGFSQQAITAVGLDPHAEGGADFAGMVTVAVTNRYGRTSGFVAYRPDGSCPVTTPETAIWKPADELAGLWRARGPIAKADSCLVIADPLQLLWCERTGLNNAVALTAPGFSEQRVKQIKKLTANVTLLLPASNAAIFEILRSALPLLQADMNVKVVSLPGRVPLDQFVDEHTTDFVHSTISTGAVDMVIYRINALRRARRGSPEAFRTLLDDIIFTLRHVNQPLLRETYINELSDASGLTPAQLRRL